MNWKIELRQLKLEHIKATAPGFFEMSGGYKLKTLPYSDQTTNKLTNAVADWLKFSGHYCNRINSQGQVRIERVEMFGGKHRDIVHRTTGTSNKGTADLDAIINGKPVKIEIKCTATGDRIRPEQLQEKARIEAAGGVYIEVQDMPGFVAWYKAFVSYDTKLTPVASR